MTDVREMAKGRLEFIDRDFHANPDHPIKKELVRQGRRLQLIEELVTYGEQIAERLAAANERIAALESKEANWIPAEEAREAVITRLLEMLVPFPQPASHQGCECVDCKRFKLQQDQYARACEIAGRNEP